MAAKHPQSKSKSTKNNSSSNSNQNQNKSQETISTEKMKKLLIQYVWIMPLVLGLSFFIHFTFLKNGTLPKTNLLLKEAYLINYFLASLIFLGLYLLRKKFQHQLGFLFMGGSFLKFAVFFVIFKPVYNADDLMSKTEFAAFFVPYFLCLTLGTYYISKMLQQMDTYSKEVPTDNTTQ